MKSRGFEGLPTDTAVSRPRANRLRIRRGLDRLFGGKHGKIALAAVFALDAVLLVTDVHNYSPKNDTQNTHLTINIPTFPRQIPLPVLDQLGNVVSVLTDFPKYEGIGSGISIKRNEVLTVGHLVDTEHDTPLAGVNKCRTLVADTTRGVEYGVKQVASYNPTYSSIPDVALIQTSYSHSGPKVSLNTPTPNIGESLYFANYEPTPAGSLRDPLNINQSLARPAIYGGVVDGIESNGDIDVLTGIKSYKLPGSTINDSFTRNGASGGPVFNATGQLEGTVVQLDDWGHSKHPRNTITAEKLEVREDLTLNNTPNNAVVQETIVQPFSPALLSHLSTELKAASYCTS